MPAQNAASFQQFRQSMFQKYPNMSAKQRSSLDSFVDRKVAPSLVREGLLEPGAAITKYGTGVGTELISGGYQPTSDEEKDLQDSITGGFSKLNEIYSILDKYKGEDISGLAPSLKAKLFKGISKESRFAPSKGTDTLEAAISDYNTRLFEIAGKAFTGPEKNLLEGLILNIGDDEERLRNKMAQAKQMMKIRARGVTLPSGGDLPSEAGGRDIFTEGLPLSQVPAPSPREFPTQGPTDQYAQQPQLNLLQKLISSPALPAMGAIGGGALGGLSTLPTVAGVPAGTTLGAGLGIAGMTQIQTLLKDLVGVTPQEERGPLQRGMLEQPMKSAYITMALNALLSGALSPSKQLGRLRGAAETGVKLPGEQFAEPLTKLGRKLPQHLTPSGIEAAQQTIGPASQFNPPITAKVAGEMKKEAFKLMKDRAISTAARSEAEGLWVALDTAQKTGAPNVATINSIWSGLYKLKDLAKGAAGKLWKLASPFALYGGLRAMK